MPPREAYALPSIAVVAMGTSDCTTFAKTAGVFYRFRKRRRRDSDDIGRRNRRVFQQRGVLRQYRLAAGWLDAGEQAAIALVTERIAGRPILDIGVGGGRTAPLLRQISEDYHGIDYAPAMVAMARRTYPDCDFTLMDARHLEFAEDRFACALFSYNGIDSVNPADRLTILREVHRVLQPGGYFAFSTLNRDGTEFSVPWPDWRVFHGAGWHPLRLLRAIAKLLVGGINHLRGLMAQRDDGTVAIRNPSAHNFALLTVFAPLAESLRQLQTTGFLLTAVLDPQGCIVSSQQPADSTAPWFHIVVRKPPVMPAV